MPLSGESLYSWFTRLGSWNGYPRARWIKQLFELGLTNERTKPILLPTEDQWCLIEEFSGIRKQALKDTTWSELVRFHEDGESILRSFVTRPYQQICPQCIEEQGIWKKSWDLNAVACCPIHKCYLVSRCYCGALIPVFPANLFQCKCGRSLFGNRKTEAPAHLISYSHRVFSLETQRKKLINLLFEHRFISWYWRQINLDLKADPISHWLIKTRHYAAKYVSRCCYHGNKEVFELLDRYTQLKRKSSRQHGFRIELGDIQDSLYRMSKHGYTGKLANVFDDYVQNYWSGRYWLVKRFHGGFKSQKSLQTHMCIREKSFSRLCDQVELEEQKAGRGRYFDSAEQARLIEYSKKNLNLGSFAKELGISSYLARSLLINSVIRGVPPDIKRRIRDWRISRDDIESFKSSISAGSSNLVGNTITIRKSLKLVLPKGVSLSGILTSVLNGSLTYDYCHHDCILDIKVSQENLNSLLSHEIRASNTTSNLLSVAEAATAIGISSKMVHALVKKQQIITYGAPGHHDDVKVFMFTTRELGKFKYAREHTPVLLSLRAAAYQLNMDRSWLRKQILDQANITLYRLENYPGEIFLSEKEVLQWSIFLDKTLTGPELARAVGVTRNTVFKWRKSGRLNAVSGPGINGFGCYRYHKREVARFIKCM